MTWPVSVAEPSPPVPQWPQTELPRPGLIGRGSKGQLGGPRLSIPEGALAHSSLPELSHRRLAVGPFGRKLVFQNAAYLVRLRLVPLGRITCHEFEHVGSSSATWCPRWSQHISDGGVHGSVRAGATCEVTSTRAVAWISEAARESQLDGRKSVMSGKRGGDVTMQRAGIDLNMPPRNARVTSAAAPRQARADASAAPEGTKNETSFVTGGRQPFRRPSPAPPLAAQRPATRSRLIHPTFAHLICDDPTMSPRWQNRIQELTEQTRTPQAPAPKQARHIPRGSAAPPSMQV